MAKKRAPKGRETQKDIQSIRKYGEKNRQRIDRRVKELNKVRKMSRG